jgi:hypothetical protein
MPERWLPTDPRQREIHRLLLLVGGEPAAFFIDAARLMDGDYRLEATAHVVAHLLRELNLSLREVLRPMVPDERWPARNEENAQAKQIKAICDALGVSEDDPFRDLWREFVLPLAELAHRYSRAAPRPVDDEFRELWAKGQIVVHQLARRVEANYTLALPLVDELAAGPPDVDRLRQQVPHSTVVLDRFFERAGVDWLEPLRAAGYFADPPPLVYEDDGSVGYSRWPAGRYLTRVAPDAPEVVIAIGLALDTDNPEAHESLIDAALALPAVQAAELRPQVEQWLTTPVQWQLPFKVQALVVHLVGGGRVVEGLALLRALVTAERTQRDRYLGAEIVRETTEQIFPAVGTDGLELLAGLLADSVAEQTDGGHDYSYIWRPHLSGARRGDLRDTLVSASRDAAAAVVEADGEQLADVVALLEAREFSIFRRLALDLLARYPDTELISARLRDRALFNDLNAEREYDALAAAHFAGLDPAAQEEILGLVDAGPMRGGDDEDYLRRWQLHALSRLPQPLPGDWAALYAELVDRYGEPEPERLPEVGFVGPDSPLARAELEAMSVAEIVALVGDWRPPEAGGWRAPSREGLARVLRDLVAEEPERFANEAATFAEVDPTYVHALVGGLRQARTNGRPFSWPSVLELAVSVLDRPRQIEGRDPTGFNGEDPGWAWTWQEIAHLIGAGFQGEQPIPRDERERVWYVLARLAEDEHPSTEDEAEEGRGRNGPPILAINSVRGAGVEAVMSYVWWLGEDVPTAERRLPEEARELLERRLDPDVEPTAAIHSLYGKWFPYLVTADPTWVAERVEGIFPAEPERRWRAAWSSYLYFNNVWENAFRLLVEQHRCGIDDLAAEIGEGEVLLGDLGQALVNHLMTAYRYGMIDFGDGSGLLERFYEVAALERRAEALESVGHGLMDATELTEEMATRLRALWERRLEGVRESGDPQAGEELRGFAWWFASGKLDPAWSLQQLAATVEAGGRIHPDHLVAERLAVLRDEHLPAVVRALELLIESGARPWFVLGAREQIEAILDMALAADGEPAARGRDVVNRLVARGHSDYERLLER